MYKFNDGGLSSIHDIVSQCCFSLTQSVPSREQTHIPQNSWSVILQILLGRFIRLLKSPDPIPKPSVATKWDAVK